MKHRPYIGELRARGFVIAIAVFLLLGAFLYSKFEFQKIPATSDVVSQQQKQIDNLQKRIDQIVSAPTVVQSGQKIKKKAQISKQSPNGKSKTSGQSKP